MGFGGVDILRQVIEHVPDGVWVLDPAGLTLLANLAMAEMLEATQEELCEKSPLDFIAADDDGAARVAWQQAEQGTGPVRFPLTAKNGISFLAECTCQPLRSDGGERGGLVAIFRDLTPYEGAGVMENQLAAIVESSDDAIVSKNLNGVIMSWNKGAERVFGYTAEEAVGKPITMLLPEDRLEEEASILARLRKGERIDHFQTIRVRKDGQQVQISVTISPIRDATGKIVGASKVARDITEVGRAEVDRAHLAAIVESSDDAIISKSLQGIIQSWNSGAERLFGYTAEEAIGQPITMLIPPERLGEETLIMDRLRRGLRVDHIETVRRAKDGRLLDVWETISPVLNPSGKVTGASKVVRDISERRQIERDRALLNEELERRVEERTAELEAANREMEGFSYSVSHDLRAPLRAIGATSALLLEDLGAGLPEDARELLERQRAAALKLATLMDDLLAFSRLRQQDLQRADIDLSAIAQDVAEELGRAGRTDRVKFDIEPDVCGYADKTLMRFVMMNLMDNACKFSPDGGTIRFGSMEGDLGTVYFVTDEGVGFDMAYAGKLFVPFERLVREEEFPGTGIGLANVQRIVQRHAGRVWASGEPGKGATFYFTLG